MKRYIPSPGDRVTWTDQHGPHCGTVLGRSAKAPLLASVVMDVTGRRQTVYDKYLTPEDQQR